MNLKPIPVALVFLTLLLAGGLTPAWTQPNSVPDLQKLWLSSAEIHDHFGSAVAIAADTAIVGAPDRFPADSGAVYVWGRTAWGWEHRAELLPEDGASPSAFGAAVALSGDTLAVGAPYADDLGDSSGAAYVFVRGETGWTRQAKLVAAEGAAFDSFGKSVAVSGDTLVVGAPGHVHSDVRRGAAYVFVREGGNWIQQAELLAEGTELEARLGTAVAVSGNTVVAGENFSESAQVFVREGSSWSWQATLRADDGLPYDNFGVAVAVSGDTAVVGAPYAAGSPGETGAAYVFVRTGSEWAQQARLRTVPGTTSGQYGASVAVAEDTAIVGAPLSSRMGRDPFGNPYPYVEVGAAYVFWRTATTWNETDELVPRGWPAGDSSRLGSAVAVGDGLALVGAPWETLRRVSPMPPYDRPGAGAAYLFDVARIVDCDDGNECTDDSYDPASGCVHENNSEPCDDGDACTTSDSCGGGACLGGPPPDCNDGNHCTDDSCDPASGCVLRSNHACDADPHGLGYWKRLCQGPVEAETLTSFDVACVRKSCTFAAVTTVADLCDRLHASPEEDKCEQGEAELMALELNVCRLRVDENQAAEARKCTDATTVGAIRAEADALLCSPARDAESCAMARCECEEVNLGKAF